MAASDNESLKTKVVDLIGCPDCGKSYLQKNIYRHLWDRHNWSREECRQLIHLIRSEKRVIAGCEAYVCKLCSATYKSSQGFFKHKAKCGKTKPDAQNKKDDDDDDEEDDDDDDDMFDAEIDDKKLFLKASSIGSSRYRSTVAFCPQCGLKVDPNDELVAHCSQYHATDDRKFEIERRIFPSNAAFKKWFDQRQEDTCTSLTKRTGNRGETFYRCHMVGKYSSVAKKRRSNPRKIDQLCTAFLKVYSYKDGTTYVSGCFTHIGHELNHRLLWLTETQENYVKELIDRGFTSDQIYHYIRQEYENYESKLKYISKNDIRNIAVRHSRRKYQGVAPKEDHKQTTSESPCDGSEHGEGNTKEIDVKEECASE